MVAVLHDGERWPAPADRGEPDGPRSRRFSRRGFAPRLSGSSVVPAPPGPAPSPAAPVAAPSLPLHAASPARRVAPPSARRRPRPRPPSAADATTAAASPPSPQQDFESAARIERTQPDAAAALYRQLARGPRHGLAARSLRSAGSRPIAAGGPKRRACWTSTWPGIPAGSTGTTRARCFSACNDLSRRVSGPWRRWRRSLSRAGPRGVGRGPPSRRSRSGSASGACPRCRALAVGRDPRRGPPRIAGCNDANRARPRTVHRAGRRRRGGRLGVVGR